MYNIFYIHHLHRSNTLRSIRSQIRASDVATIEEHTVHFQLIAQGAAEKGPQGGPEKSRRVVATTAKVRLGDAAAIAGRWIIYNNIIYIYKYNTS
jgi:hypothetical protein